MPRQQLVEPGRGVVGDARKHVGEPSLRVDGVESGGLDERVEDGGALAAPVRAAEQPRLAAERHAAQRPLGGVVRDADPAIVEEAREGVRTWVFAARHNRCPQAMLRSGFSARHVTDALLAFLCATTLLDRHDYGTMRFAEVCYPHVSDDEARVLTLFAAARANDPCLIRTATGLVSDDMAVQFAGAVSKVETAMLPSK